MMSQGKAYRVIGPPLTLTWEEVKSWLEAKETDRGVLETIHAVCDSIAKGKVEDPQVLIAALDEWLDGYLS